ncbi:MAG: AMP-dependent synthetase/ligase [Spirochaetia bacterium]
MKKPWEFLSEFKQTYFTQDWPSVAQMFEITCARYPENNCFTTFDPVLLRFNYTEALREIRKLAAFLDASKVQQGDAVVVSGKNSPEWAIAYLAVLYAGCRIVPIDYQLETETIDHLSRYAEIKAAFIDEEKFDDLQGLAKKDYTVYSLSKNKEGYILNLSSEAEMEKPVDVDIDTTAAILFTSGTTGKPKGVMLSHRNLVCDTYISQNNLTILSTDVFYAILPIHHSYTMTAVFLEAISVGAEVVFGKRMATQQILKDLKQGQITMLLGVPLLFNKLLKGILKGIKAKGAFVYGLIRFLMGFSGFVKSVFGVNIGKKLFSSVLEKASLNHIRICISGGGPLASSTFQAFNQLGINFVQGYGLTETSPIVALNPVHHFKIKSVGQVLPRLEFRIADKDAEGRGEIQIKGPVIMQGYLKDPESTQESFTDDGFFKTGDVGYLDSENYVYLTGRKKSLIVTEGGKNVYPEEIENKFQLFDEVEQILVRGYELDKEYNTEGIEAVIFPNLDAFSPHADDEAIKKRLDEVIDEVNSKLLPYQKISKLTILNEPLEMTTTKKIKRYKAQRED